MADCAPLLDEELSSFVFNYLTETSDSQYGEEEVCSDRLDTDFPDIDLSQLDASDFDSVNCLSELHWCNDQPSDASPASIHYSTADELFETEEHAAALLAALTDSLDGMVDTEEGALSVFPALGEEPDQEEKEDGGLPLNAEDFSQSLGAETEDSSLLMKLLLTPPNVPTGLWLLISHSVLCPRPQSDIPQERKPRAVRPAGRLCTELHRHLTTAQDAEDNPAPDTEEDEEEEEEDEDSESEEEDEEEEEEEEEESSSSEAESAVAAAAPVEPAKPQFSSEKELHSVVELIRYMHTYCMPTRKQQGWERKDRELPALARSRARPEAPRPAGSASHSKVVAVVGPGASGGSSGTSGGVPRRLPFAKRREMKANSLLRELLEQSSSFDVSKPYRLHSPPYSHSHSPSRGGAPAPSAPAKPAASRSPKEPAEDSSSFSVRRSRRLASFPSRFAKRLRPGRARGAEGREEREKDEGRVGIKLLPTQAGGGTTTEAPAELLTPTDGSQNNRGTAVCLSSPSGLTPPTTPPHKPVEDELFKPAEGGKGDHHQRKLPEQTELYAQLRRMGQAGDGDVHRTFGDHDYCALSLGESRKRSAAMLGAILRAQEGGGEDAGRTQAPRGAEGQASLAAATPPASEEEAERSSASRSPSPILHLSPDSPDNCQVFYIHNLPSSVTQNMLRKRFQVFGNAEDCSVIIRNEERCGVIKIRQSGLQRHWRARETLFQSGTGGLRRVTRKRYIDLDEAGPGPVKSKYDALDFDTLLKEAQKSLHR
uniref:Peroxisome proliferator-activated receptor gamma, coactivator 1 beta n=1 Tax=Myripristis murdjan TaxID=586833 RepID=A0A667Y9A5_9TELE